MASSRKAEPGKAKSSPTRARVGKAVNGSGEGKKLGSLSSFQATLNFTALPSSTSAPSRLAPSSASSSSASSSTRPSAKVKGKDKEKEQKLGSRKEDADKRLMPPPPTGLQTKSRLAINGDQKTNGKAVQVVQVDSDSSDDDVPGPSRKRHTAPAGMWADIYPPRTEADLAPSKKRVEKVREWLQAALYGYSSDTPAHLRNNKRLNEQVRKYKRILFLSGPAGACKTTTIRVLAKDMGIDLLEWGESVDEWGGSGSGIGRESAISKMSTFIARNAYSALPLSASSASSTPETRPRVLFLSSLPNISHAGTKEAFHAALRDFCTTYTASSCPMIIVHSEAGTSGVAEESWRERERGGREGAVQILGKEVKDGPWVEEIEFLPVAPTFAIKALKRVLENAAAASSFPLPTVASVQYLALNSNGDLRSAVNALQLLCMQVKVAGGKRKVLSEEESKGAKRRKISGGAGSGKGSRGGKGAKIDIANDLREVLEALTRKEQSLHLFHALGKVLYNKRLDDPPLDSDDQALIAEIRSLPPDDRLPPHLKEHERRKSLVQMDAFAGSIPLDASSFALWIHQSIPSFCSTIEQAASAVDELCAADIMRTDDDIWQSSQLAISYALQISIRGAQLALPSPVPRNHQKILKPQFFPSFKDEKKSIELLDMAAAYLGKKAVAGSIALAEFDLNADAPAAAAGGGAAWGGFTPRQTLATELVPMLVKMQDLTRKPLLPGAVAPLRMPQFGRLGTAPTEELTASQVDIDSLGLGGGTSGSAKGGGGDDDVGDEAGVLSVGWDMEDEVVKPQENGWLEDDDIIDFD